MLFFNRRKKEDRKVDFLIVGAQKCGTTSLHEFLAQHPDLISPPSKELYFFSNSYNYNTKGIDWYHAHWKKFGKRNKLYFESSPDYFYFPFCAERIAKYNPGMKFLLLVRDPVKRAYSHYNMLLQIERNPVLKEQVIKNYFVNMDAETEYSFKQLYCNPKGFPSFEELVEEEMDFIQDKREKCSTGLLRMGLYMKQLERYYAYYPKERFIIFENRELDKEPLRVLNTICAFLEVVPFQWDPVKLEKKHNKSVYADSAMSEPLKNKLSQFFKADNEAFFSHIGKKFEWS